MDSKTINIKLEKIAEDTYESMKKVSSDDVEYSIVEGLIQNGKELIEDLVPEKTSEEETHNSKKTLIKTTYPNLLYKVLTIKCMYLIY